MEDLWPAEIKPSPTRAPATILREQASLLGRKTNNVIKAEVSGIPNSASDSSFRNVFYIVAPALSNYRYRLLSITHGISFYPLKLSLPHEVIEEFRENKIIKPIPVSEDVKKKQNAPVSILCESEEVFIKMLRHTFASAKVLQIISSLVAQSSASDDEILF